MAREDRIRTTSGRDRRWRACRARAGGVLRPPRPPPATSRCSYSGDANLTMSAVRNIHLHGWFASTPQLGVPYGQDLHDFPTGRRPVPPREPLALGVDLPVAGARAEPLLLRLVLHRVPRRVRRVPTPRSSHAPHRLWSHSSTHSCRFTSSRGPVTCSSAPTSPCRSGWRCSSASWAIGRSVPPVPGSWHPRGLAAVAPASQRCSAGLLSPCSR